MDVEEQPSPNPTNVKRFGLKNSIQTNFGDDYVFQIVPKYVPFFFIPHLSSVNSCPKSMENSKVSFIILKRDLGSNFFY